MLTDYISSLVIPLILLAVAFFLAKGGKSDYLGAFARGASEGLRTTVGLVPTMVLLMTGLSMLTASGALEIISDFLSPLGEKIGVPAEIIPLIITRPVSGSAANASFAALLDTAGADSFAAFAASVIMGSSDTVIYIISVYFSGASHVKKTRHAVPIAILIMLFCVFFSCFIARMFMG